VSDPRRSIRREPASEVSLDLLGPMRLTGADGTDHTPRSPQRQALLAVIALSGTAGVSRARLQDLFWSDKEPHLAAQSLRTALHGLRRDLAGLEAPLIEIDPMRLRLAPRAVRIDLLSFLRDGGAALPPQARSDPPDMLEGIDVPAEGFEEWLRDQRVLWHERIAEGADAAAASPAVAAAPSDARPVIGLLSPVIHARSVDALYLGDAILDRLADGLRDYVGARVFDYRDRPEGDGGGLAVDASPDLYLRFRLYEVDGRMSVRVLVLRRSADELLWSVQGGPLELGRTRIESAEVLALLGEVIERVAGTLERLPPRQAGAPVTPFHALTAMFRLNRSALDDLRAELERAWDRTDAPIYPALLAYLNTFRVGEHWHAGGGSLDEETRRLVSHVRGDGTGGGLAFGLAGHALGYVLHDHDGAGDLLDRAIRLSPHSAFCWDHLALHCVYGGRYDHAQVASGNALRIGAFSPIEFTMQTTRCMIATLQGDFGTATGLGARVLSQRPTFGAALRYMSIGLAHKGDIDGAQDCVRRIRTMDPGFSVDWVGRDRMAVRDERAKAILTGGLVKAGAT
jgi:hypothetical protein